MDIRSHGTLFPSLTAGRVVSYRLPRSAGMFADPIVEWFRYIEENNDLMHSALFLTYYKLLEIRRLPCSQGGGCCSRALNETDWLCRCSPALISDVFPQAGPQWGQPAGRLRG